MDKKEYNRIPVSATEYGVFRCPEGLEGWRLYRIEYGGCNEDCLLEQNIWLPPTVNIAKIIELIRDGCKDGKPYRDNDFDDNEC